MTNNQATLILITYFIIWGLLTAFVSPWMVFIPWIIFPGFEVRKK